MSHTIELSDEAVLESSQVSYPGNDHWKGRWYLFQAIPLGRGLPFCNSKVNAPIEANVLRLSSLVLCDCWDKCTVHYGLTALWPDSIKFSLSPSLSLAITQQQCSCGVTVIVDICTIDTNVCDRGDKRVIAFDRGCLAAAIILLHC